jgi:hypothetical protein
MKKLVMMMLILSGGSLLAANPFWENDWREWDGAAVNVGAKRRYCEDMVYAAQLGKRGIDANQVMPGWEPIYGKVLQFESGVALVELSEGRRVTIKNVPVMVPDKTKLIELKPGQSLRFYAHLNGPEHYDYGRVLSGSEVAKLKTPGAVAAVEKKKKE